MRATAEGDMDTEDRRNGAPPSTTGLTTRPMATATKTGTQDTGLCRLTTRLLSFLLGLSGHVVPDSALEKKSHLGTPRISLPPRSLMQEQISDGF